MILQRRSSQKRPSSAEGWVLGAGAYALWVAFPLYFSMVAQAGAIEVIAHRAFWGLLTCLAVIALLRKGAELRAILRNRALTLRLLIAGVLIVINWTVYVYAVLTGRVVDAAFGYFINPLVTVALGVIVLRERLTRAQKVAVTLGTLSVVYLFISLHIVPWISLALALSFGTYSLVKKAVAAQVPPLAGMAVETSAMVPILLVYYGVLASRGGTSLQHLAAAGEPWGGHFLLLIGGGILTVIPLLMFARASQSLPLGSLGLMQYINPIGQTLVGVYVMGEAMPTQRWIATGIVCLALVVLSVDAVRAFRGRR